MKGRADTSKWPQGAQNTHVEARVVDLRELATFLEDDGYIVLELQQRWRHVHGVLKAQGTKYFFKLASTHEVGVKTANEVAWNRKVADIVRKNSNGVVIVPMINRTGVYHNNFFYLADYYEGELAADHDPPRTDSLLQHLSSLVEVALHLHKLQLDSLWDAADDTRPQSLAQRFLAQVDDCLAAAQRDDLFGLRALVEPLRDSYVPRVSHGDFVPWHVIISGNQRILIDAEHAWSGRPQYYDVAYFYHRLATAGARPDLARVFLSEFQSALPVNEREQFLGHFLPVLAARSIAGFYDATLFQDQKLVMKWHEELKSMVLQRDVF